MDLGGHRCGGRRGIGADAGVAFGQVSAGTCTGDGVALAPCCVFQENPICLPQNPGGLDGNALRRPKGIPCSACCFFIAFGLFMHATYIYI